MPQQALAESVNEIHVVGRLAAEAAVRELPSGDVLVSFRVVVDRPATTRSGGQPRGRQVDTLDCSALRAAVRRAALRWEPGDVVELHGALRRRFWRSPGGPASRYEVEVLRARRVAAAG
jgi:single-strand DNA-binding protein